MTEDEQALARLDGWSNPNVGLGGPMDQSNGLTFDRRPRLKREVLEALYEQDAIAARAVDRVVDDAMREGWCFKKLEGTDRDGNTVTADQARELLDRLNFNERFTRAAKWGRLYGGSVLVMPVLDKRSPDMPLGEVPPGGLLTPYAVGGFDAIPQHTDSAMGSPGYGQPIDYQVTGIENTFTIHASRVIAFEPIPMPYEVTLRADTRWGPSVLERLFSRLGRYGASQAQALGVMWNASLLWIKFQDWRKLLSTKNGKTKARELLQNMYSNLRSTGLLGLDTTDEMGSIDRQLANLDSVMLRFRDAVAEGAEMPREILFNESPAGLNAGELSGPQELWFAHVGAWQREHATPKIRQFLDVAFRSWGWDVAKCEIGWLPLWTKSEEGTAAVEKVRAETDALNIQSGIIDPEEARRLRFPDLDEDGDGGEDGPALDLSEAAAAEEAAQADKVQDLGLNGAQITALADLVARVVAGEIPRDAAVAIAAASFPAIAGRAEQLIGSAGVEVVDLRAGVGATGVAQAETDEPDEPMPDDVVSAAEAGALLGVSPGTVRSMARAGKLRAWKPNGRFRVSKRELLNASKYEPPTPQDQSQEPQDPQDPRGAGPTDP